MNQSYEIKGVGGDCPFCNGKPKKNMPVFQVTGPWSGTACAAHLETLIGTGTDNKKAE